MNQFDADLRPEERGRGIGFRLYEKLKSQISEGAFPAGEKLPSTRSLAAELGVSRSTITLVYEQLAAEGYVRTAAGSRARVTPHIVRTARTPSATPRQADRALRLSAFGQKVAEIAPPPLLAVADPRRPSIDFLYGALSSRDFPLLTWRRAYTRVLLQRQMRLYYEAPEGEVALREALQGYLRRSRGLICEPDQILVVHGSQQAIDLCARVLVDPGDPVLVEEPCYLMARRTFEAAGASILPAKVDDKGLVTSHLPRGSTKLAYITPSHQFPLGGVMPIGRRQELLAWAQQSGAWIVEDDYDGEFRYGMRPVDSLQSIDHAGCVIYVGTFSKTLSPQLRLGYMVLPSALVPVFRQAKRLTDRHAPRLDQQVLATLIGNGAYERHVRRIRRENERRRGVLLEAIGKYLPGVASVEGSASGLHLVLWLHQLQACDEDQLVQQARTQGVGVWPISPLYAERGQVRPRPAGLILGYASLAPNDIQEGVRRLAIAVSLVT